MSAKGLLGTSLDATHIGRSLCRRECEVTGIKVLPVLLYTVSVDSSVAYIEPVIPQAGGEAIVLSKVVFRNGSIAFALARQKPRDDQEVNHLS
jgi:hypothetical protein